MALVPQFSKHAAEDTEAPATNLDACYLLGIPSAEDGIDGHTVLATDTTFEVAGEESPGGRRGHGWIVGGVCQVPGLDASSN